MTPQQSSLLLIPAAYFAGAIPFGLLVGKAKGVDPRNSGSGNIGATNVGRLLGLRFFVLVFILDVLKGLLPMLAAGYVMRDMPDDRRKFVVWLAVGFAAIFGHMFSVFIRFKGGKGVATSTGVLLGLWPFYTIPGLVGAAVWLVTFKIWRYVSLSSILGCLAFPIAYVLIAFAKHWDLLGAQLPLLIFAVVVAGLIVYKHRTNIARLRAGTELRAGRASSSA